MSRPLRMPRAKLMVVVAAVTVLSGCASVNLEQNLSSANAATGGFTDGQLTLARGQNERDALRQRASDARASASAWSGRRRQVASSSGSHRATCVSTSRSTSTGEKAPRR